MRDSNALAAAATQTPGYKPTVARSERTRPSFWRIGDWFGRKHPTLYQRCLALHMHHARPQTLLH